MHANNARNRAKCLRWSTSPPASASRTVTTGDTLSTRSRVVLESMDLPEPVITWPSSPRPRPTRRRWASPWQRLSEEDPTFRSTDEETGQTIIRGMGELHLEVLVDRMMREFNVSRPTSASPRSPTARRSTKNGGATTACSSRQTGGRASTPRSRSVSSRRPRDQRFEFGEDHRRRDAARVHPGVDQRASRSARKRHPGRLPDGRRPGRARRRRLPRCRLVGMAFKIAGSMGFKEAARKANRCCSSRSWRSRPLSRGLSLGDVIGDLNSAVAVQASMERGNYQVVRHGPAVGDVRLR